MLGYDSEKKDGSDTSVVPADAPIYMADKEAAVAGLPDGVNGVFGREDEHDIKYGKLTWGAVAVLMIAEIVSNGMLSLPSTYAVVGIVPATVLIIFLGIFALYTSFLLIDFKVNHPEVHNMGDAGYILGGPIVREICSFGTCIFAILAAGTEIVSGALSLAVLSDNSLCSYLFQLIVGIIIFLVALPRVLAHLSSLGVMAIVVIVVAVIVAMIGAGVTSSPQAILVTRSSNFYEAFLAVTNPTFSYAGHFMFFILISEMKRPADAWKSAVCLQVFAIVLYTVFGIVMYVYYGQDIQSPAFSSLPPVWAKAAYGIALLNFVVAGGLYVHTATKIIFIRLFRKSHHLHSHTALGWGVWTALCALGAFIAFIFAVAVPIFNYLVSLAAALFAAWFTYGLAGAFFLHDYRGQYGRKPIQTVLAILTLIAGGFICVAGVYATIKLIVDSYASGAIPTPFTC